MYSALTFGHLASASPPRVVTTPPPPAPLFNFMYCRKIHSWLRYVLLSYCFRTMDSAMSGLLVVHANLRENHWQIKKGFALLYCYALMWMLWLIHAFFDSETIAPGLVFKRHSSQRMLCSYHCWDQTYAQTSVDGKLLFWHSLLYICIFSCAMSMLCEIYMNFKIYSPTHAFK